MSKLDSSAELVKLGQLLHVPSAELQFLEGMSLPTLIQSCLLYTSPSPRDRTRSRMPSSA